MTLGEFFQLLTENPFVILFYFIAVPMTAALAWILGKDQGHLSPWKYLYCGLIYLSCVPGIFSLTLNAYLFLFERQSILDANIYTQILPIFSMGISLWLIRKNVSFDDVPGFDKISGLLAILAGLLTIMWVIDRLHIIAITIIPFYLAILILVVLLVIIRLGFRKFYG